MRMSLNCSKVGQFLKDDSKKLCFLLFEVGNAGVESKKCGDAVWGGGAVSRSHLRLDFGAQGEAETQSGAGG